MDFWSLVIIFFLIAGLAFVAFKLLKILFTVLAYIIVIFSYALERGYYKIFKKEMSATDIILYLGMIYFCLLFYAAVGYGIFKLIKHLIA